MEQVFDVAIIGGGINGCGCAADAALRGLSVVLIEQDDLASKTSSKSSKLIHGGLRYLENYDFTLVKKALEERQKLLHLAPHLIQPLPFVIPHQKSMRPLWLLRLGLTLYDYLCRTNTLPHTKFLQRQKQPTYFSPLAKLFNKGFLFYDGITDDARLTITNALQAKKHGAIIMPHTKLLEAKAFPQQWQLSLQNKKGESLQVRSKTVINATGPWIENINQILTIPMTYPLTLVKGSHIVVPKLYEGEHAYMLQHSDKRVVFTIPYYGYTLIGTTEILLSAPPENIIIEQSELNYLSNVIKEYFNINLIERDFITTWSGIRPLISEEHKTTRTLSRDYAYQYANTPAPAVTIYGGKITTYRKLAIEVINTLVEIFPNLPNSETENTLLPGAATNTMGFIEYQRYALEHYHWLDKNILERYLNTYGTNTEMILAGCSSMEDLGKCFMPALYQKEVDYLVKEEWASSCEDILWRRTKLGLNLKGECERVLNDYLNNLL